MVQSSVYPFHSTTPVLSEEILSRTPTELRFFRDLIFLKEMNNQNLWNFELGSKESINILIRTNKGFQQRNRQDSQDLNTDTFRRLPVYTAQCVIGNEKEPNAGILLNARNKEVLRAVTKDAILQPYITDHVSDLQISRLMMLVINYTFSISDISKNLQLTNLLK